MIRCALPRGSNISVCPTYVRRYSGLYGTAASQNVASSPSPSDPNAVLDHLEHSDEAIDRNYDRGGDLVKPCTRRDLPLSPLMDPKLIAAREKWHKRKQPPGTNPTPFQLQLARNPYAQALATPPRQCQLTKVILPRYFLQDFNVVRHPETGQPFYVPRSLVAKPRKTVPSPNKVEDDEGVGGDVGGPVIDEELHRWETGAAVEESVASGTAIKKVLNVAESKVGVGNENNGGHEIQELSKDNVDSAEETPENLASGPSKALPNHTSKLGSNIYILARRDLLNNMLEGKSFKFGWASFTGPRMFRYPKLRAVAKDFSWRIDMDTFTLELMRRRAAESLFTLIGRRKGYIISATDWNDAKAKPQTGAILCLGEDEGPPEMATLSIGNGKKKIRKVAVHNLQVLFGPAHIQQLKEKSPVFESHLLVMRHRKATTDLQLMLWKLQGFLAEHRETEESQS
ncbi:hypothetical protein PVAG01_08054 [Phlyctema vagabunda]|uniref:Uncharacterized protein n=1 Tax=Phlyctema vagabunda TaxID=108571 RepID=A0ABR4P8Y6_9HELO